MTIFPAYGKGETRSTWGKEIYPDFGKDNSDSPRDIKENQGGDECSQRLRSVGANTEGTSTPTIAKSLNGKLARQLRKWLQSQLAETLTKKQEMLNGIDKCDQTIMDLRQDLEEIEVIIQELEETETHTETN